MDILMTILVAILVAFISYLAWVYVAVPLIASILVIVIGLGIVETIVRYMPTEDDLIKYRECKRFQMVSRMSSTQELFRWYGEYEDQSIGDAFRFTMKVF